MTHRKRVTWTKIAIVVYLASLTASVVGLVVEFTR